MPEKTIIGDKLWDEILKAIVSIMPGQLFPLIKEVYGITYPPDTPVRFLSTEHSTYQDDGEEAPSSNQMDLSFLVGEKDYYHMECQMKNDKVMVIRMISYDLHYAIEHCISEDLSDNEMIIRFPRSMVLYPDKNSNIPEELRCRVIFQDDSEHIYRIPTVKIQSYSLEEIHEKHLTLFTPYLLLRLKPRIKSKKYPLTKKELTDFVNEIILILQDELTNNYLTKSECSNYIDLLLNASRHIFYHDPKYHKEVQRVTKPLVYLSSVEIMELKEKIEKKDRELTENKNEIKKLYSEIARLKKELNKNV